MVCSPCSPTTGPVSIDTSGETKDKGFIADFVIDVISESTPKNIVAVCMDGACMSSFAQITEAFPWVVCFICPTHSLDNFLKSVCGNQDKIRMAGIFNSTYPQTWEYAELNMLIEARAAIRHPPCGFTDLGLRMPRGMPHGIIAVLELLASFAFTCK